MKAKATLFFTELYANGTRLLTSIVVINMLSRQEGGLAQYGLWLTLLALQDFLSNLVGFRMSEPLLYYLHNSKYTRGAVIRFTLWAEFFVHLLQAILLVSIASLLQKFLLFTQSLFHISGTEVVLKQSHLWMLAIILMVSTGLTTAKTLLQYDERFKAFAKVQAFEVTSRLVLFSIGAFFGIDGLLWALLIHHTLLNFVCLFASRNLLKEVVGARIKGLWAEMKGFYAKTWTSSFFKSFTRDIDKLLLGMFGGFDATGIYGLATKIAVPAALIGGPVVWITYPRVARFLKESHFEGVKSSLRRSAYQITAYTVLVGGLVWLCREQLYFFVYGYWQNQEVSHGFQYLLYPFLGLILIKIVVEHLAILYRPFVMSCGRPGISLFVNVISGIAFLTFGYMGLQFFGPIGVVVGNIASLSLVYPIYSLFVIKLLKDFSKGEHMGAGS